MPVAAIVLWLVAALAAAHALLTILPHFLTRRPPPGSAEQGLVVFVESIRWLNVAWGRRPVAAGLHRAGFQGLFRYWRWHTWWRGWLVLPAIMDRTLLERQARHLADFLTEQIRLRGPGRVHVIGYSAGGYVAVRALELLDEPLQVASLTVLAGALSPWRDLHHAGRRSRRGVLVCSSVLDWLIAGLGTLVFGTADRRHVLSMGMLGPRGAAGTAPGVRHVPWRPRLIRWGHWGGHFAASAAAFVRHVVAPDMGLSHTPATPS